MGVYYLKQDSQVLENFYFILLVLSLMRAYGRYNNKTLNETSNDV